MRIKVVECDNCGRQLPADTEALPVGRKRMDFCWPCKELILEGRFQPRDEHDELGRRRVEQERSRRERELESDLQSIRDHCARAIELWAEGKDELAREQITRAAARAAGQRREVLVSGRD